MTTSTSPAVPAAGPGPVPRATWADVVRTHHPDFSDVVHVPGLLHDTAPWFAALEDAVGWALDPGRAEDPRLRVYRDSMLDYRRIERTLVTPWARTGLERWFEDLAEQQEVCVAFNECDRWSPRLSALVSRELVAPLTSVAGDLGTSLEWYSFVGASGWTPFGIHRDPEVSMIFHLGPHPKEVWVWSEEALPELPGGRPLSWDMDTHVAAAQHVVLQPGDFLSIPAQRFHVFRNNGFSAFLGLMIHPQDPLRLASETLMDLMAPQLRMTSWAPGDEISRRVVDVYADLLHPDHLDRASTRLADRSALARSRAFAARTPVTGTTAAPAAPDDARSFPVVAGAVTLGADGRELFVRGRVVRFPAGVDASRVVASLERRSHVSVGTLATDVGVGLEASRAVVAALANCAALVVDGTR